MTAPRVLPTDVAFAPPDEQQASGWRSGRVTDLSDEGLFVACNSIWPPATRLDLVLVFPGDTRPTRIPGVVRWARTADVAGMFVGFAERAPVAAPERPEGTGPAREAGADATRTSQRKD